MCGGGSPPDNSAALNLQRQQIEQQQKQFERQMAVQQTQYQEQQAIATAPPPPAPNPTAIAAASAIEGSTALSMAPSRQGTGRRALRTDISGVGTGGLSIPGA